MKAKPWLKLWTEIRRDAKLTRIDPAWRWVWVALLTLAQESQADGRVLNVEGEPMADDEIAAECGVPVKTWQQAKAYFARVRTSNDKTMIEIAADGCVFITQLAKRQAVDPTNAARQARHRKSNASNALRNASRNGENNGTEHRASEHRASEDRGQSIEDREHNNLSASSSSEHRGQTPKRAAPVAGNGHKQHDDDDAGPPEDAPGMLLPPADFTPEQTAAWNLVLLAAPNFDHIDQFVRGHNPQVTGLYALVVADRDKVYNPAGLIRSLVESGTPPPAHGGHRARWLAAVADVQKQEF